MKINLKLNPRLKEQKSKIIIIIIVSIILFFGILFIPFAFLNLAFAIMFIFIGIDYYKRKDNSTKKKVFCGLILFISIFNFFMFFSFLTQTNESLTIRDGELYYQQEGYMFRAETYLFDNAMKDQNGQVIIQPMMRYPLHTSLYHHLSVADRVNNLNYTFQIKTNLHFKDYELQCKVYGSNNIYWYDDSEWQDDHLIHDFTIIVDETESPQAIWKYDSYDNITCDGDDTSYEYYQFVFITDLNDSQDIDFTTAYTYISIKSTESNNEEWGFSERYEIPFPDALNSLFVLGGSMWILTIMAGAIFIIFVISFLLFWAVGQLRKLSTFLLILTMSGIILLFVMLIMSSEFFIIKEVVSFFSWLPDPFGLISGVIFFVKLIGMIIAVMLWFWTIGNILILIWGLYYIFNRFMGGFSAPVWEAIGRASNKNNMRRRIGR